jgi:hypothetical protein
MDVEKFSMVISVVLYESLNVAYGFSDEFIN